MITTTSTPPGGGVSTYVQFAILAQQRDVATNVANLEVPGGTWRVAWGPAWNLTDSNLAYAAEFTPTGASTPTLAAVVIRGTDVEVDPLGFIGQAAEDLRSVDQDTVPWDSTSPAKVSRGTVKAFDTITTMTAKGAGTGTMADYLATVAQRSLPLVITGHSLGGGMTTALALWAAAQFSSLVIQPVTFAAPAIGNQAFMDLYQSTFANNLAFVNSLDVVPNAWASLAAIPGLYTANGLAIPSLINDQLGRIETHMAEKDEAYVQQSQNSTTLTGTFVAVSGWIPGEQWAKEVLAQHVATNYATLLQQQLGE